MSRLPLAAFVLTAPVMLAACATGPAQPARATLSPSMLEVRMTDGRFCEGPAPALGAEDGWSGTFTGCPWAYDYTIDIDPGTNPIRFVVEAVAVALGAEISPVADIRITDTEGRQYRFVSPNSRDRSDD